MPKMQSRSFKQATGDLRPLTATEKARLSRGEYPLSTLKDSPVASETTRAARAKMEALGPRTRSAIRSTLKRFKKFGNTGP